MDPLSAARYGMMSATRRFETSAERVARSGDPEAGRDVDMPREVVEQIGAKHQFSASAQLISAADDMWRALISAQEQTQRR
jgi:flagellar hook-associated protein FlgK